jgi:hypothetical protein
MKASNRPVTSREYKVMLNSHRFKDRKQGAEEFLELIAFLIGKEGGTVIERQNKEERRQTSYLDSGSLTFSSTRMSSGTTKSLARRDSMDERRTRELVCR